LAFEEFAVSGWRHIVIGLSRHPPSVYESHSSLAVVPTLGANPNRTREEISAGVSDAQMAVQAKDRPDRTTVCAQWHL